MSLHDRATTIIADLITKIGPLDPNTEAETIEAIKKLALDAYQHGRSKAEAWNAVISEAEISFNLLQP